MHARCPDFPIERPTVSGTWPALTAQHRWRPAFTDDEVRDIRQLRREGLTLRAIADLFYAHDSTIHKVVHHHTYRHVSDPPIAEAAD